MTMHPDLEVLIDELKLIRDNVYGGLKSDSKIYLTHSEVISFARAFVQAVDTHMIEPFHQCSNQVHSKIMLYLNLIRTPGIPHCDRSRAAAKCVEILEAHTPETSGYPEVVSSYPGDTSQESIDVEMQEVVNNKYPNEYEPEWENIPF